MWQIRAVQDMYLMKYQAMIRLVLDHDCVGFGSAAKSVLSKIYRIQVKAIQVCSGATLLPVLETGKVPIKD